jgi:hypothetical protein
MVKTDVTKRSKCGLQLVWDADNKLTWGTWDNPNPGLSGTAGSIDGGAAHTFRITLHEDGSLVVSIDGKIRTGGIRAGAASNWRHGIPAAMISVEADATGVILNTRFSNVQALSR